MESIPEASLPAGYDLYIKKDGKWLWAAAGAAPLNKEQDYNYVILKNMDNTEKECLLYLPLFSEENSIQIGVQEGATITKGEAPFRHRIGIFGSSFTHGVSSSRPGMTYPAQFTRNTGIQMLSIGCSGNCKMQTYFADALADADVDAFVFDSFSNPDAAMIKERLFPFIEKLQAAHPGGSSHIPADNLPRKKGTSTTGQKMSKQPRWKWLTA